MRYGMGSALAPVSAPWFVSSAPIGWQSRRRQARRRAALQRQHGEPASVSTGHAAARRAMLVDGASHCQRGQRFGTEALAVATTLSAPETRRFQHWQRGCLGGMRRREKSPVWRKIDDNGEKGRLFHAGQGNEGCRTGLFAKGALRGAVSSLALLVVDLLVAT
jgi:hypothetical protein